MVTLDEWRVVRLGKHASFLKGSGLKKADLVEGGPESCIHYGELFTHYGAVIETVTSGCRPIAAGCRSLRGDVLMPGSDVTPRGLATASALMVDGVVLGGDVIVIRPSSDTLFGPYLANIIRFDKANVLRLVKGSTVYHVYPNDLAGLMVPLPPFKEQEAIAEALVDSDAAIEALDALIAKKRNVKQATMQQLLSGCARLPGFTEHWEELALGSICSLSAAPTKKADGSRFVILDMGSVARDGSLLSHKRTDSAADLLEVGDLVMPKDDIGGGQIIGKAVVVPEADRFVLGDHVYRLRLGRGCPSFIRYAINSHEVNASLRSKVVGSAQLGLGRKAVLEQAIPFPPLKEQEAIAAVLLDMDAEIEALVAQRDKLRLVKQGMMQELLSGRVRLV